MIKIKAGGSYDETFIAIPPILLVRQVDCNRAPIYFGSFTFHAAIEIRSTSFFKMVTAVSQTWPNM